MRAVAISALVALTGCREMGDWGRNLRSQAVLHYDGTYLHSDDETATPDRGDLGLRVHGIAGHGTLGYAAGFDLHGGYGVPAAGRYEADLFLLGLGWMPTKTSFLRFETGIGAFGATHVDDGAQWPFELGLEFPLRSHLRVIGRARADFRIIAPHRIHGALDAPDADATEAMLGVRLGKTYRYGDSRSGNGYYLGATIRDEGDVRFYGLTLGYSLNVGFQQ